jgi:hypothetical protein
MALPNIDSMTPQQAKILMDAYAPSTVGATGDYSDLDTFRSYTFTDPNYQYEDFRQLAEIAGFGKEDELASAQNISSGAATDTFRITDPLDMGTNTGALSNIDTSSRKPFPTAGENLTDEEYQQRIKDLYNNAGLPAPGEPGYNPSITPPLFDLPEDYVPPEINPLTGQPNVSQPVAQDLSEDGSPQPEPTTLYGSDYSLENLVGGQVERLYLKDPSTGKIYDYNYSESEFANNIAPPPDLQFDDLQLVKAIGRNRNDNTFGVDIDPTEYAFGGRNTPERSAQLIAEANREPGYEKGGGGLFYEYNNRTYYTPDNTGTSIPVGSTNIGRTTDSDLQLEKTYEGYQAPTGATTEELLKSVPDSGTFLEAFTPQTKGGRPFDLGQVFGLGEGVLEFSNPPSNRFNVGGFFNQAESFGTDNFIKSQQRDTLQMIKDGNFFQALAGDTDTLAKYPTLTGQEGLNEVLNQLQGIDNDPTTVNRIDPSFEVDPFDTDSSSQVASITGDEGTNTNTETDTETETETDTETDTPEETEPYTVRAFKGGGLGPFASNYIFQRFGYRPQQTIDLNLTYDPVEKLYFFENGSPVDPKFLENMQLTKLDEDGNVVYDDENNPVTMPRVVVNEDETTSEEE